MIELLAPAGTWKALVAAIEAGADAVYLAGKKFGARAYAENFSEEELLRAVEFAHLRGVKVHVTVNTIIADKELEELTNYLKFLQKINIDALIIQDLGVASIAKIVTPNIPLHASTQMTIHSLEGVEALSKSGFSRVILSRELSLNEIKKITRNTSIETEIFIHGAICICWSGQCLMSSLIGGRSGNRGCCAQPCRMPYELIDENGKNLSKSTGKYLLSPKDLNTLKLLPKLVETGVTSLKIEGRMKRPEYVAIVVKVYRETLDNNFSTDKDYYKLAQIFNRDFTTAYLEGYPNKNLINEMRPNNRGVLIGRVIKVEYDTVAIRFIEEIHSGDEIEIWIKVGGRLTILVKNFEIENDVCTIKNIPTNKIRVSDRVFKVFDAQLAQEARKFFNGIPIRKIPLTVNVLAEIGNPLKLSMTDDEGNFVTEQTNFICEATKKYPLTIDTLKKQIGRLGNSIFRLENISVNLEENLMVPISELNNARRKAIDKLKTLRLAKFNKSFQVINIKRDVPNPYKVDVVKISAQVDTIEKLKVALKNGADEILYGGETFNNLSVKNVSQAIEFVHDQGKKISLATPRIIRERNFTALDKIFITKADAIYVHNLATFNYVKKISDKSIRTDFSLIVFNIETIKILKALGIEGVTLSPELNLTQVNALAKKSLLPVECIVHGRQELMISDYCIINCFLDKNDKETCSHICRTKNVFLRDRMNEKFPIVTDQFCRTHILNSKILSMIENRQKFLNVARLRIDCRMMDRSEIAQVVRAYKYGGKEIKNFTRGHYFRGVTERID